MVKKIRKLRRSETVPEIMRKTGLSKASVYRALSRGAMHLLLKKEGGLDSQMAAWTTSRRILRLPRPLCAQTVNIFFEVPPHASQRGKESIMSLSLASSKANR